MAKAEEHFREITRLLTLIPELAEQTNRAGTKLCRSEEGQWKAGYDIGRPGIIDLRVLTDGRLFVDNYDFQDPKSRQVFAAQGVNRIRITRSRLQSLVSRLQDQSARKQGQHRWYSIR